MLIIAISSDRGLCGSFNSTIFKGVQRLIAEKYAQQMEQRNVVILPIGKRAFEFFSKRNYPVVADYWDVFHGLSFDKASRIAEYAMENFRKGEYDRVEIVYNYFKNVATQILMTEQYLPVRPIEVKSRKVEADYIFQPDQQEIMSGLIPKSLKVQLYKAILDSNAAENGARMTAMDKATENAGELLKALRLTYNRTRQASITKEILEIFAGAEALKSA